MNLDFIPTHCFHCRYRLKKPNAEGLGAIWCQRCKINGKLAFYFDSINGNLSAVIIRLRDYEILWTKDKTVITQISTNTILFNLNYLLPFDFTPEDLLQQIHILLTFS